MIETSGKVKRQNSIHLNIITMHIQYVHGSKANTGLEYIHMNKFIGDETVGGCHLYLLSIHLKYLCSFFACTTKKKNIIKEILRVGQNGTRQRRKRECD